MTLRTHEIDPTFRLRFWGVRGSLPTPFPEHMGIGGNTPCMQVLNGPKELLIFDAGTGIRALGREIAAQAEPPDSIHIFFTHFHWDHLQGLPYFLPIFTPKSRLIFHSAHPPERLHAVLAAQMRSPYFPVLFEQLHSHMEFRQTSAAPETVGSVTVESFPLHHPQGSVGYRIKHPGRSVVYATDHEHGDAATREALLDRSKGADVLVYDAQYTPDEYSSRCGWGHSTWAEATRLANDAEVKQLVLFHHDPDRDDAGVAGIEEDARREFRCTVAAHEKLII